MSATPPPNANAKAPSPWQNEEVVNQKVAWNIPNFERDRERALRYNSNREAPTGYVPPSEYNSKKRSKPTSNSPSRQPKRNTANVGGVSGYARTGPTVGTASYPGPPSQYGSQYSGGAGQWRGYQQAYPLNAQAPQYGGPNRQLPTPYASAGSSGSSMQQQQQQQYDGSGHIQQPPYYSTSAQYMPKPSTW